ncbi:NADP-dependent phosphogluconate dehydrogenase [Pseudoroseicyclus aestuarii]|uniref:6-phosphogluconate dehydrogenase, decarboxylating n=1 Tax=Pseudoroseicyclus aestuarii TaxID=1795041 RepID=A0A318SPS9_9RHOB|nr:NADP-dependent phosphogluconate dehydrogenase [Pseudoroseicyclus aestuarii]PYE82348.1 6-phosphogluconate dehydrogenase (decarboxylating) [Pseudoroseicyclus aestuarii]
MTDAPARIGLIGLGTMGGALTLNIAEEGFPIAVWNIDEAVTRAFPERAGELADKIVPCMTHEELVAAIQPPRAIILLIPAGEAVDQQIAALTPLLDDGDMIIDMGNANFHDTNRRAREAGGVNFLGMGISGGEEGARHGPAIMAGGRPEDWARVEEVMTAVAAKHEGEPCAALVGPEGAGHFVKAVHNGIEYADMQMIAEVYGLMRDGMGMGAGEIAEVFEGWVESPLRSYLIEISAEVARATDPETGKPALDVILDAAGQKGTGRWTAIEAQHLGAPVPAIEAAVQARNLSAKVADRAAGEALFGPGPRPLPEGALDLPTLQAALIAGKVLCYDQGFGMISAAGRDYGWDLPLPEIAKIWREGCIIRSAMLDDMAEALAEDPDRNLMMAPYFSKFLVDGEHALRTLVAQAAMAGIPVPALASGLAYFDAMRTARGTANMIQAQRDYFGAHGFDRLDGKDIHHGPWAGHGL